MANMNDPKSSKKNLDPAAAQKLRQQLANKVSELTDEELSAVAGGTTPTISAVVTAAVTAATTEATKTVIASCGPSGTPSPGPVPSPLY